MKVWVGFIGLGSDLVGLVNEGFFEVDICVELYVCELV